MKIAVCIRQVPDTASSPKISEDGTELDLSNVQFTINPFDEYALEEALRIKDADKETHLVVVSVGDETIIPSIKKALALGVDEAIHLKPRNASRYFDPLSIASALADELRLHSFDLILFGKKGVDNDNAQTGTMVAQLLGIPCVPNCTSYKLSIPHITAFREVEGGTEIYEVSLPVIITQEKGDNELRYPSLKDLISARRKTVTSKVIELRENTIKVIGFDYPPIRAPGRIVGTGVEAIPELVRLLREDAKVL
ncbi:MAG: electron transfer flavoprotein subunit beta/FixA family protein [Thaumarchaeota archaeon]|nr:electron transfer flavoprotein subunit beta/FixA family protein [Nitrososphaerota archaeon]